MNRDCVLDLLRTQKASLTQKFGVSRLALFGSVARESATSQSDFDATVRNIEPIGQAAIHVPEAIRRKSPDIPWREQL